MTKFERIAVVYLLVVSTVIVVLNIVLLNKKTPPLANTIPAQAEVKTETKTASDTPKLTEELAAIRNELSQIRAIQRGQNQALGASDTNIDELLDSMMTPTPFATPTAQINQSLGMVTLKTATSADIHQDASSPSSVIGRIYFATNYSFSKKQGNWYFIKAGSIEGWVNASLVKEIL